MNGVVYKQWYSTKDDPKTQAYNVQHLKYIATRPGAIQNPGCGFGLWGRMGHDTEAKNIDNLKTAMAQMRRISKEHTVYRAVLSLDEDTAIQKGLTDREEWQTLVTDHAEAIAKQNNIDITDFRWCASYHQERGHPHVHILFWDNSNNIREEYMGNERFEIAAEKIRAAFNGDIFKEELKNLRADQDKAQKELRILSRNHVEGFAELSFFDAESRQEKDADVQFYPRDLKPQTIDELCRRLDELVSLLPKTGQLKYQYLEPNVKAAVDAVSNLVLNSTSLQEIKSKLIDSVIGISETYGNSPKSIQRQIELAEKRVLKDIGNDVLKTVKSLGWLNKNTDRLDEMHSLARERMLVTADAVLFDKLGDAEFKAAYEIFLDRLPMFLTPKHEVLTDDALAAILRDLTLKCLNDPRLMREIKISQAFESKHKQDNSIENSDNEDSESSQDRTDGKDSEEFKAAYIYVSQRLYDMAATAKGWDTQAQFLKVNNFLRAFCKMASPQRSLSNANNRFLLLRELSKQAKKERGMEMKSSSNMWDAQL